MGFREMHEGLGPEKRCLRERHLDLGRGFPLRGSQTVEGPRVRILEEDGTISRILECFEHVSFYLKGYLHTCTARAL